MLEVQANFQLNSSRKFVNLKERCLELDHRVDVLFESLADMARLSKLIKPGITYVTGSPANEVPMVNQSIIAVYRAQLDELKATVRGQVFFYQNPEALTELEAAIRRIEEYFLPEKSSPAYIL